MNSERSTELESVLNQLVKIADEFDEECDHASKFGYSIEYALSPCVEVSVDLLRTLRELMESDRS